MAKRSWTLALPMVNVRSQRDLELVHLLSQQRSGRAGIRVGAAASLMYDEQITEFGLSSATYAFRFWCLVYSWYTSTQ
jgi:hypothetical protein